jgi:hypothetical protein
MVEIWNQIKRTKKQELNIKTQIAKGKGKGKDQNQNLNLQITKFLNFEIQ